MSVLIIMELLAQCSHSLYNEELLHAAKRVATLEREIRLTKPPKIKYDDKESWRALREVFRTDMDYFILDLNNIRMGQPASIDVYLEFFVEIYVSGLNILTMDRAPLWCRKKGDDLKRLIKSGFSGLKMVENAGRGTFPFTNWRKQDFRYFILGIKNYFENEYEQHLFGGHHGWVEQIPYYHCMHCDAKIDGVYLPLRRMRRFWWHHNMDHHCIPCIKKILKSVTFIQALWRGYYLRCII